MFRWFYIFHLIWSESFPVFWTIRIRQQTSKWDSQNEMQESIGVKLSVSSAHCAFTLATSLPVESILLLMPDKFQCPWLLNTLKLLFLRFSFRSNSCTLHLAWHHVHSCGARTDTAIILKCHERNRKIKCFIYTNLVTRMTYFRYRCVRVRVFKLNFTAILMDLILMW